MKRRILLVDDEVAVLLTLKAVLEISSFDVEIAASASDAISKLRTHEYDMVITDMRMESPSSGEEVISTARAVTYKPIVALLTAFPASDTNGRTYDADLILAKPMHTRVLVEKIEKLFCSHEEKVATSTADKLKLDKYIQNAGYFILGIAFLMGFAIWIASHGIFNQAVMWITLMGFVALGMRLVGRDLRSELALVRNEFDLMREHYREEQADKDYEQEQLEACRERRERREAIRAGEIEDDGLSEFGREIVEKPEFRSLCQKLESLDITFPPVKEDIFSLEERDKRMEAAWRRKVVAEEAWEKLRNK